MAKVIGIYKITSPSGKVYIGSSADINRRFYYYKKLRCQLQIKLYNSFIKHGVDNHKFEIIHRCELDELFKLEAYYGSLYNVLGNKQGLNLRLPKIGEEYAAVSDDTILRMSQSMILSYDKRGRVSEQHKKEVKKAKNKRRYNKYSKKSEAEQFENRSSASQTGWLNPERQVKKLTKEEKKTKKYEYQIQYRAKNKVVVIKPVKEIKEFKQSETHRNNLSESRKKSGVAKGSNNPKALLTDLIVIEIRKKHKEGSTLSELYREYKMSKSGMHGILKGISWKHLL